MRVGVADHNAFTSKTRKYNNFTTQFKLCSPHQCDVFAKCLYTLESYTIRVGWDPTSTSTFHSPPSIIQLPLLPSTLHLPLSNFHFYHGVEWEMKGLFTEAQGGHPTSTSTFHSPPSIFSFCDSILNFLFNFSYFHIPLYIFHSLQCIYDHLPCAATYLM